MINLYLGFDINMGCKFLDNGRILFISKPLHLMIETLMLPENHRFVVILISYFFLNLQLQLSRKPKIQSLYNCPWNCHV